MYWISLTLGKGMSHQLIITLAIRKKVLWFKGSNGFVLILGPLGISYVGPSNDD